MSYNITLEGYPWVSGVPGISDGGQEGITIAIGDRSMFIAVGDKIYLQSTNTGTSSLFEDPTILRTVTSVFLDRTTGVETWITFTPKPVSSWSTTAYVVKQLSAVQSFPSPQQFFTGNLLPQARADQIAATVIAGQG